MNIIQIIFKKKKNLKQTNLIINKEKKLFNEIIIIKI